MSDQPRIAILGAGPIGLEATLYARYLGYPVQLLERGESAAANVLDWGHVSLFSPIGMNVSTLGVAAIQAQDPSWQCPEPTACWTGREYYQHYLRPLAASDLVSGSLQCDTEVLAIGRPGWLKGEGIGDALRGDEAFSLLLRHPDGNEELAEADIVIDCTGTYGNHNWLGPGGTPAVGERDASRQIDYDLPDVLGDDRDRFAGKHTLVIGSGYSAATAIVALAKLPADAGTQITWITRRPESAPIRRIANDRLASRDALAEQANQLATGQTGNVAHHDATTIRAVCYRPQTDDFEVELAGNQSGKFTFDRIIANVGYRPDNQIYRELQVHECYASGGPMKLAAQLLSQNGSSSGDCLDQQSQGPASLLNPEPNFYILGSKSYGRGPQFLISIGLEQIRDLFTLIGDREDLDLYATMPALS